VLSINRDEKISHRAVSKLRRFFGVTAIRAKPEHHRGGYPRWCPKHFDSLKLYQRVLNSDPIPGTTIFKSCGQ
jgi:hypothetical protein